MDWVLFFGPFLELYVLADKKECMFVRYVVWIIKGGLGVSVLLLKFESFNVIQLEEDKLIWRLIGHD